MVSLIIPMREDTYTARTQFREQCLASIEAQTYRDFEIIEVKSNHSVAVNTNIGLYKAKGEFFKVIGDDDWLPPTSLADLVEGMKDHPWICSNAINVSGNTQSREIPPLEGLTFERMVQHNVVHNGTTLHRTKLLKEIGGMDESLWTAEEYEMHLRLMSKGYLPGYINKFVYFYRLHREQQSRQLRIKNKPKRDEEIRRIQALYSNEV